MTDYSFVSLSGIVIDRIERKIDFQRGIDFMVDALNNTRGAFLSSGVEDQDRYSRWEFGFIDPPLEIVAHAEQFRLSALNPRGAPLLAMMKPLLLKDPDIELKSETEKDLILSVARPDRMFAEEERSRQPSTFTPIRALMAEFNGMSDDFLGLWGAFGFDLIYEFEQMPLSMPRTEDDKLLHLYLPDRIMVMDRRLEVAFAYEYEFTRRALTTHGMGETAFTGVTQPSSPNMVSDGAITSDHSPEDYMGKVDGARERIRVGDIFEVVLSRKYQTAYHGPPSEMFRLMQRINPSPYEFFFQFADEQLIGASPEMFVRVDGDRVESSPISGTARRGENAMEDAERILALYNSWKDEVELTMCTDVDRNDKSRICRPGTIKLLARRAIERYAGLFHTVDHVEGRMREGFDGIDAFLSHMWAVTLTGAPKRKAVEIIEDVEVSPRRWYGGAIGALMFSGTVNTGITIRTVHLENGRADYRVGATLVWDSVPAEEEEETRIKSTAFFKAVASLGAASKGNRGPEVVEAPAQPKYTDVSIIMVDNEDSFVHTLADYFRQTGAEVKTFRHGAPALAALAEKPDLVIHSPGPGQPKDFGVPDMVRKVADLGIPQFGICLGLQGMVEAFGGELTIMDEPRHGKYWQLSHDGSGIFDGIAAECRVGGYHSLLAVSEKIPEELDVIARNEHDMVMAIRHKTLPLAAVQFHPESILSMDNQAGLQIVENVLATLLPEKGASERAA